MKPRNDIHGIMKRTVWGAVISRNHNWHILSTSFQISVINKLVGIAQQADNIKPPEKRKRGRPRTRWMDDHCEQIHENGGPGKKDGV